MTCAEVARQGARRLQDAGFAPDEAAREAGLLARARLGWDEAAWIVGHHQTAPDELRSGLPDWIDRRARHEPVAYIVGRREFYGRPFLVTPAVLVPRPETEIVVDAALAWLADRAGPGDDLPCQGLDIGTGSGCLAVTLALEDPHVAMTATDLSAAALEVARANAAHLAGDRHLTFVEAPLAAGADSQFDLIVSNPPYVASRDRAALPPDVRDYEPALALFGGPDGLDVVRALLPSARRALRPAGRLICEIGDGQADEVRALLPPAGLRLLEVRPDLAGRSRVIVAEPV